MADGGVSRYLAPVRGCSEYAARQGRRVKDACNNLEAIPGTPIFATLTYPVPCDGASIVTAIEDMYRWVAKFMRRIRKYGDAEYVIAWEYTARGYPHAHILWVWRDKFFEHKIIDDKFIYFADQNMFNMLKSWQPAPVFHAHPVVGGGLANYIGKYLSKGINSEMLASKSKDKEKIAEIRKRLMCSMLAVMSHHRQYCISQGLRPPALPPAPPVEEILSEEVYDLSRGAMVSGSGIWALESGLNKSTSSCRASAWILDGAAFGKQVTIEEGYFEYISPHDRQKIYKYAQAMGCPGCPITQWLDTRADIRRRKAGLPCEAPPHWLDESKISRFAPVRAVSSSPESGDNLAFIASL
jgi:hypothetical protein